MEYTSKKQKQLSDKFHKNFKSFIFAKNELEEMFFRFSADMEKEKALEWTSYIQFIMLDRYRQSLNSTLDLYKSKLQYLHDKKDDSFNTIYWGGAINNMENVISHVKCKIKDVEEELIGITKDRFNGQ